MPYSPSWGGHHLLLLPSSGPLLKYMQNGSQQPPFQPSSRSPITCHPIMHSILCRVWFWGCTLLKKKRPLGYSIFQNTIKPFKWKCKRRLYSVKAFGLINCRVLHNKAISNHPHTMGNRHQLHKTNRGPDTTITSCTSCLLVEPSNIGSYWHTYKRNSLSQYLPA